MEGISAVVGPLTEFPPSRREQSREDLGAIDEPELPK